MRMLELKRDPRVSPRDVAPRHMFVKLDDSCDLTETWPRTDPSFFDNVAVSFLARSLGRETNGYDGSFSYMSSKHFFESTLDIAFDHRWKRSASKNWRGLHPICLGLPLVITF